jgi:hypothetical protein
MKTGYEINGQDLADLVEYSRDPATDPVAPLASYGFKNTGKDFPVSNIPSQGSFPGTGVNINSYLNSDLGSIPPLLAKGCRPRFGRYYLNFSRTYVGSSQRKFYYLSRTDTDLYIFQSYSRDSNYSLIERININDPMSNQYLDAFAPTSITNSGTRNQDYYFGVPLSYCGIPKYIYAEITGGGGGGAGGVYTTIAWVSSRYSYGGSGGSGAGHCLVRIPIGPYRSNYSVRSTSTDYCFSIHNGGSYGDWTGWENRPNNKGSDGTNSYVYYPNGSIMVTAPKGRGGSGYDDPTDPYSLDSATIANSIFSFQGGQGSESKHTAPTLSFDTSVYIEGERLVGYIEGCQPGPARTDTEYAGGGGGYSRGKGGAGSPNQGNSGWSGFFGGGGGGGWGQLGEAARGGSGGPGCVSFFY